jgi:hypothetical protein
MKCVIALIAGRSVLNRQFDQLVAAQLLRQPPCGGLVEFHEWRVYAKLLCHPERKGALQRLNRFGTTVRISGKVRLAHSCDKVVNSTPRSERCGRSQEQQIAPRDKSVRQTIGAQSDRDGIRQRRSADLRENIKMEEMIGSELFGPLWEIDREAREDGLARPQFYRMALAIGEADRFDTAKLG